MYPAWKSSVADPHLPQARLPNLQLFLGRVLFRPNPTPDPDAFIAPTLTPATLGQRGHAKPPGKCGILSPSVRETEYTLLDMKDNLETEEWSH